MFIFGNALIGDIPLAMTLKSWSLHRLPLPSLSLLHNEGTECHAEGREERHGPGTYPAAVQTPGHIGPARRGCWMLHGRVLR